MQSTMVELPSDAIAKRCPSCDSELAPNAVLCVACGYQLLRKRHLGTVAEQPVASSLANSNPYHPPAAAAARIPDSTTVLSLFWIRGRIPRWQWWTFQVAYVALVVSARTALGDSPASQVAVVIVSWLAFWMALIAQIKRWHDMDKSGFWCLVNLIPILGNMYALIELGFQRGTEGPNDYGDDPSCS